MSAGNGRDALGHNALTEVICEMVVFCQLNGLGIRG
jgi:hypothetical protein